MAQPPLRPIISAAGRDVWNNKLAALKAGWPQVAFYLVMVGGEVLLAATTPGFLPHPTADAILLFQHRLNELQLAVMPLTLVATPLCYGGWTNFITRGEAEWSLKGRNILAGLAATVKLLAVWLGVAVLIGTGIGTSAMGYRQSPLLGLVFSGLTLLGTIGLVTILLRLALVLPYAAASGRSDFSTSFRLSMPHVGLLFRLVAVSALLGLLAMLGAFVPLGLIAGLFAGVVALGYYLLHEAGLSLWPVWLLGGLGAAALLLATAVIESFYQMFLRGVLIRAYLTLTGTAAAEPVNPWHVQSLS